MPIRWTQDLTVGIEAIDQQHQRLFEIVDGLLAAMQAGKGRAEVSKVLDFLNEYVLAHFALEERAMQEMGDPNYASHKGEHDGFVKTIERLKRLHEEGGARTALVIEVNHRVCGWLRNHIAKTDVTIRDALEKHQGVVVSLAS
ncbi:MAG TPA: hemerythrin [Myxococcales bacterium]|jgi:hemerythrin|nr:hemerythrin [Myxococcales bacterium]